MFLDPLHQDAADWTPTTAAVIEKQLRDLSREVERAVGETAEIERLETALQTVVGVVTANRLFEIIRREPEEKHAAFLKTTLEAALGGADYSACTTLDDMGSVYAKWVVERNWNDG